MLPGGKVKAGAASMALMLQLRVVLRFGAFGIDCNRIDDARLWEMDFESTSLPPMALNRYVAAHQGNKPSADSETHPPAGLSGAVAIPYLHRFIKNARESRSLDAGSGIADANIDRLRGREAGRYGHAASFREFDRIAYEVIDDTDQLHSVGVDSHGPLRRF